MAKIDVDPEHSIVCKIDWHETSKKKGVLTMGSRLEPTLANVFMCHFENFSLENCPCNFKRIIYRRFVDDTFLLFQSKDHIEKFRNFLNKQHKNMKFTSEIDGNRSLSFLDTAISREDNKFATSVYRKPTFSRVFTNFESFIPDIYKRGGGKVFVQRDLNFMVPKREVICILPCLGKVSLYLRTRLRRTVGGN